jgi:hypothetical protein
LLDGEQASLDLDKASPLLLATMTPMSSGARRPKPASLPRSRNARWACKNRKTSLPPAGGVGFEPIVDQEGSASMALACSTRPIASSDAIEERRRCCVDGPVRS